MTVVENDTERVGVPPIARMLGVARTTVTRWAERGRIPSAKQSLSGRWTFDPVVVAKWAEAETAKRERATP